MKALVTLLLETVENETIKIPSAYAYNLSNVVSMMLQEGMINITETTKLKGYLKENLPTRNYISSENYSYRKDRGDSKWQEGNMKPRIKWLKKEIKKF